MRDLNEWQYGGVPEKTGWYEVQFSKDGAIGHIPVARTQNGNMVWVIPGELTPFRWRGDGVSPTKIDFNTNEEIDAHIEVKESILLTESDLICEAVIIDGVTTDFGFSFPMETKNQFLSKQDAVELIEFLQKHLK